MVMGLPLTSRNLILTGYIEPNSARVAQQTAAQLKMPFVDVEQQLEQRLGGTLEAVRASYGDRHIKAIEDEVMADIVLHRSAVIRVNGSTLMHGDHLTRLQETGAVFCLVARLDAILQRLHLALGSLYHDPARRATALGELRREWAVRKMPGVAELDMTYKDERGMVLAIADLWQQVSIERA
jgi:shikimate kinase